MANIKALKRRMTIWKQNLTHKCHCCPYIETNQLICTAMLCNGGVWWVNSTSVLASSRGLFCFDQEVGSWLSWKDGGVKEIERGDISNLLKNYWRIWTLDKEDFLSNISGTKSNDLRNLSEADCIDEKMPYMV